jgi:hypothetical protein
MRGARHHLLRGDLARADQYIAAAESRIARHRRTVAREQATGRPPRDSLVLLGFFEATLEQMIAHRAEIIEQLRKDVIVQVRAKGRPAAG